jgi:hypothetical protein
MTAAPIAATAKLVRRGQVTSIEKLSLAVAVLVALHRPKDLLLCAKHLFVAAIRQPSPVARTRFETLIYLKGFVVGACGALAPTNKSLA